MYCFFHHLDLHWDVSFQHEPINYGYFPTFLNLDSTIMFWLFNIQLIIISNICFVSSLMGYSILDFIYPPNEEKSRV